MKIESNYNILNFILLPFQKGKSNQTAPINNTVPSSLETCSSQTSKAVSDTMKALIEIQSQKGIFPKNMTFTEVGRQTENLVQLYNYSYQNPVLSKYAENFTDFTDIINNVYKYSVKTDFNPKERIPVLKKLAAFGAKPENKELFNQIGEELFNNIFVFNEDYLSKFDDKAIENVNRIMNSESLTPYKESFKQESLISLLNETKNNKIISKNISLIEKALKRPEYAFLADIETIDPNILKYDGDLAGLLKLLKSHNATLNKGEKLKFYIDYISGETNIIIEKKEGESLIFKKGLYYDRNLKCNSTSSSIQGQMQSGQKTLNTKIKDLRNNTAYTTRELFDESRSEWVLQSHIQEQRDEAGKLIQREIIKTSNVEGAYNIKTQDAQGHIHTKSLATKNSEGTTITKNLVSPDGTISKIRYKLSPNGKNEAFGYQVSDSQGNILAEKTDYKTHLSDAHIKENINGKKYNITLYKDEIIVFDEAANKYSKLDIRKLAGSERNTFKNILKMLPAPELVSMSENLESLEHIADKESRFFHFDNKISSAADAYIIEHEYGHCKNGIKQNVSEAQKLLTFAPDEIEYKIASDKKLQQIFAEEKRAFDIKFPKPIRQYTNYFTSNLPLKGEKLGRVGETISEFNALKNMAYIPAWIMKRAHFLQENFPKTAAYLLKHVL